mgnify:CR=1 FL=1
MKAIDFVVRTSAGAVQFGEVAASGGQSQISAEAGSEISLNLRQADVAGYARDGSSLEITLADGRVVVIEDYFSGDLPVGRLFISADGYLNEVTLIEGSGDAMFAQYGPTAEWGKWSPDEALIFLNEDGSLIAPTQVAGMPAGDDEVSMLAALPLLGGFAGGGAAAAAAGGAGAGGAGWRGTRLGGWVGMAAWSAGLCQRCGGGVRGRRLAAIVPTHLAGLWPTDGTAHSRDGTEWPWDRNDLGE